MSVFADYPWALDLLALPILGGLLLYFLSKRRWHDGLDCLCLAYLAVAWIASFALVLTFALGTFESVSIFFLRVNWYVQSILPLLFYALAFAFMHLRRKPWELIAGGVLLVVMLGVEISQGSIGFVNGVIPNAALVLFLRGMIWAVFSALIVIQGVLEYRRTPSPLHRNRLAYVALASAFFIVLEAVNLLIGMSARSLSAGFEIAGVLLVAYAILRHALADLRTLLRQAIYFFAVTAFTIGVYVLVIEGALSLLVGLEQWQKWAGALIAAIGLTFVYQPLHNLLQRGIARVLFGRPYDAQLVVQDFSQRLSARIDLEELGREGRLLLERAMGARTVVLLVVSKDERGLILRPVPAQVDVGSIRVDAAATVAEALAARRFLLQYDIDRLPRYADLSAETRDALKKLQAEVLVPIVSRGALIGVWVIGAKISADAYTDADLALLSTLADQSAVALENARLLADLREQMLQISGMRDYLDSTMASIATGVITLDRDNKIVSINRAAEKLFRLSTDQVVGQTYDSVLPNFEGAQISLLLIRLWAQTVQDVVRDTIVQVPGRGQAHLTVHLSPLRRGEDMVGIAMVIEDMTDHVRLEMERRVHEQEARRVRSTFEHYVSATVVEGLLADPRKVSLGGERQLVTVLFADIHGFTALSEKLAPEDLVGVLNGYLTLAAQTILQYEGTLDKFLGDGIMAIFNAPLAQPDHAWRAVLAALALQRQVNEYSPQLPGSQKLYFRIGLHTGEAVVGNIGTHELMNYTAIGDTVNLAKRLQENAEENQILMTRTTFALVEKQVVVQPCRTIRVKGRDMPVEVFPLTSAWE